jgi:UDP-N-acetylmuramoylalanine--D-glutamate ligase
VILIAGGDAKGANMNDLIPIIKEKAKCVVLMGKDADKIEHGIHGSVPAYRAKTIEDAVQIAAKLAEEGENVLLSPACASLDQFQNYQDRGDKFTAAVLRLAA